MCSLVIEVLYVQALLEFLEDFCVRAKLIASCRFVSQPAFAKVLSLATAAALSDLLYDGICVALVRESRIQPHATQHSRQAMFRSEQFEFSETQDRDHSPKQQDNSDLELAHGSDASFGYSTYSMI